MEAVVEERNKQMDTGKAIFVLWEYFDLLQKEGEDLREQLDALETLVVCHVEETKLDENQCPKTMAAIANLENILLARAKLCLFPRRPAGSSEAHVSDT